MTKMYRALTPAIALLAVLAIACGGDSDENAGAGAEASPPVPPAISGSTGGSQASSAPTVAASAPTAPAATPAPTLAPESTASGNSLSLENVESYRFEMTLMMDFGEPPAGTSSEDAAAAAFMMAMLGNLRVEGAYVAPDRYQYGMNIFGFDFESIQIGDQAWTNEGAGWALDPTGGASAPIDLGSPSDLPLDTIPLDQLQSALVGNETVNGAATTHYSFDKETIADFAAQAGETTGFEDLGEVDQFNMDLWVTEDGVPVKMTLQLEGESEGSTIAITIEYNIKDLNDPSISIQAPI